jgi:hypothetical protein
VIQKRATLRPRKLEGLRENDHISLRDIVHLILRGYGCRKATPDGIALVFLSEQAETSPCPLQRKSEISAEKSQIKSAVGNQSICVSFGVNVSAPNLHSRSQYASAFPWGSNRNADKRDWNGEKNVGTSFSLVWWILLLWFAATDPRGFSHLSASCVSQVCHVGSRSDPP